MKVKFLVIALVMISQCTFSQTPRYNGNLLDTLEQISQTNAPSKHFAKLYYKAIEITNQYAHTQPQHVKDFIFGFENKFGPLFFNAHNAFVKKDSVSTIWKTYFSDTTLNELQYQFLGMNAHINGDMWAALANAYTLDTLKKYKAPLLKFQAAFNVFFDSIYNGTKKYKYVKLLNILTLGNVNAIGKKMVYNWRRNAVKIAIWHYEKPAKFYRRLRRSNNKMKRYNRFALRRLR